ncbi:TetR/AcrR family transcriptional regulator [Rhodococcus sp. ARC_M6]|uniref:TetR/AcrR family transcriptional regulator n=1 Tax=Rhodococcus sp. ARC_M6 TaxID=2928852 RepID=UPI001FB30580|nr:TetR/AcrR family transcriptional regulator [Rhodococcus sp. ARC_M6]MCJ0902951.1 TetR/AcrR family transcriptional regulator [Rhodococcus sp. ARC_M6]
MAYRATERTRTAAEQRRQRYLDSATGLVARHGFVGAKVKAIAEECDTSVGSVYSYFDGRADLLAEVFRSAANHELQTVGRAVEQAGPSAPAKIEALVATFASRALAGRQLAWSLLFEPVDPSVEAERLKFRGSYVEMGEAVLREGIASGEIPAQHPGITAAALVGAIAESLVGRLTPTAAGVDPDLSDDAIVTEIQNFCRRAIGAQHP